MVGWHHRLDGHEFEHAKGVGDGQEAWHAAVHGVTKKQTQLSDCTELKVKKKKKKNKKNRDGEYEKVSSSCEDLKDVRRFQCVWSGNREK